MIRDGEQARKTHSQRHTCLINSPAARHSDHCEGVCVCVCAQPTREQRGETAGLWRRQVRVCVCRWGSFKAYYRVIKWWKSLSDFIGSPPSYLLPQPHTHTHVGWVPIIPVRIDIQLTVKVELHHLFTLTPLSTDSPIPSTHLLLSHHSFHFFPDPWLPYIFLPQQQNPPTELLYVLCLSFSKFLLFY